MPVQHSRGFTLIELMIVVAVVGILAAIAYPSYIDSIRKSRRADAKSALLDATQRQERFFTENNQYTATIGAGGLNFLVDGDGNVYTTDRYYTLAITNAAANAAGRISTFTITATPVAGTTQEKDATCPSFSLNHLGVKCVKGGTYCSNGDTAAKAAVAVCW